MKKLIFILLLVIIVVIIIIKNIGQFGLGAGSGLKKGEENDRNIPVQSEATSAVSNETTPFETEKLSEASEKDVVINVKQDEYYIDGESITLDEIKEMITKDNLTQISLENNYASSKAWEELKKVLSEKNVSAIEK